MLRSAVRRPVCLGVKPHMGPETRFLLVRHLQVCWCGAPSLTRGQVCRLQLLLGSSAQSFSGPSPAGHIIIFYCLRFETPQPGGPGPRTYIPQVLGSLFVASYDSQGYGGIIWTRLHAVVHVIQPRNWPHRKRLFHCCVFSRCWGNVSTELFPSSGYCTVASLHSCYLAMRLHITVLIVLIIS
jgi:hypothetical protein